MLHWKWCVHFQLLWSSLCYSWKLLHFGRQFYFVIPWPHLCAPVQIEKIFTHVLACYTTHSNLVNSAPSKQVTPVNNQIQFPRNPVKISWHSLFLRGNERDIKLSGNEDNTTPPWGEMEMNSTQIHSTVLVYIPSKTYLCTPAPITGETRPGKTR